MVGEVIADRYELEELVGKGGMSSVYRAHDRLLERKVAIKILHEHYTADADYVERFRREARAAAKLSHPNIVTVIDRGEADGRQFIVFEYVDGKNLKQLVEEQGRLPVRTALELAIEAGRALAFAHANGLVHRDVKPQNVLLGNGDVKVTDFGIARSARRPGGPDPDGHGDGDERLHRARAGERRRGRRALGRLLARRRALRAARRDAAVLAATASSRSPMQHVNDPPPSVDARPAGRPAPARRRAAARDGEGAGGSLPVDGARSSRSSSACLAALGQPDDDRTVIVAPPATHAAPAHGGARAGSPRSWRS